MNETMMKKLAKPMIVCATLIWGSTFFILKDALDNVDLMFLMAFRFGFAAVLLGLVFWKRWKTIDRSYWWRGGLLGLFMFLAYSVQNYGLMDTTPGKNAFFTAVYCVIVPFLYWAVDKLRPDRYNISAALLCLLGIGMVAITSGFSMRLGDSLTLVGAMFYAAHIVALAKFTRGHNPLLLTTVQFFTCGIINWILQLFVVKQPVPELTAANISALLYLTILCSAVALTFQSYGQKYTEPATAAILLSLESVFGVIFSIIFYHEAITLRMYCGFGLIFLAVIISETKLSFLKPRQQLVSLKKIP